MKVVLSVLTLTLLSLNSYAGDLDQSERRATKQQRVQLCNAVNALSEVENLDLALDMKKCKSNRSITAKLVSEGNVTLKGNLLFNAPNNRNFKLTCVTSINNSISPEESTYCGPLE